MAVTQNSFTGNGSTTTYSFTFPYLKQDEIKASLDGTATTAFTTPTATTVQFNTAPGSGVKIKIFRETDSDSLAATFYAGSAIKSEDLNDNFTQNLYAVQEVSERYLSNLGGTMTGDLNLGEDVVVRFEGATDNAHETTLTVVDPTADRTITLPNVTGTVVTTGDTGTVDTGMIAADAINGTKLADNAVDSEHYTDGSIDTVHIADVNITTAKLANDAVTTAKITDANVTTAKIADLNVTTAKIAADAITGAKIADDSIDSEHYVDGSIDTAHIADSQITSAKIADGTIVAADLASNAVTTVKITDANVTTAKIADSNITTSKLVDNAVTTAKVTDANITTAKLIDNAVTTAKITDANVTTAKIADANVTTAKIADDNVTTAKIPDNAITTAKIADAELTTLAGMPSGTASVLADSTALTATTSELNILDNKTFRASGDGNLTTTSDTEMPSSKVIAAHVASSITAVGGFKSIADEVSFPATASMPATGVAVSINNAAGVVVNGSGISTTGRTVDGTPATVTINGFPSSLYGETLAAGVGLIVQATSTANTYTYHKLLAAETDVKQLSDDINDFNARYRVASSAPGSNNDAGDMYFDTSANKMKVYNGTTSAWDDVASVGNFYINTISSSSGTGGGSATFNGSAYRFTLSNAPTSAQQLIVSVNGVIQKPNAGSSQPSEGFAISGNDIIFSAAPASGSDYFIITQGSSVSIGTPSDNTVATAKIQNLAVTNDKIANDTIAEGKLDISNAPSDGKFLQYKDSSDKLTWSTVNTDVSGDTSPQLGGNLDVNTKNIILGDSSDGASDDVIKFGAGTDLSIYSNGTEGILGIPDAGTLKVKDGTNDLVTFSGLADQVDFHKGVVFIGNSSNGSWSHANSQFGGNGGALTHLNLGQADNTGTVATARLGSGTANSGTFLAGDNTWQAISAAPEITATASGAIAANKPVCVNSNGTISEVAESVTPSSLTEIDEALSGSGHYVDPDDIVWLNDTTFIACWMQWNDGNKPYAVAGTISGSTISLGSRTLLNANNDDVHSMQIAVDRTNGVFLVIGMETTGQDRWLRAGRVSSGTTISLGSSDAYYAGTGLSCCVASDDNGNFMIAAYRSDHGAYKFEGVSVNSSNNITHSSQAEFTALSNINNAAQQASLVWDKNQSKYFFVGVDSSDDLKGCWVTSNGSSTAPTITSTNFSITDSKNPDLSWDDNGNQIILTQRKYDSSINKWAPYAVVLTPSGTNAPSIGTQFLMEDIAASRVRSSYVKGSKKLAVIRSGTSSIKIQVLNISGTTLSSYSTTTIDNLDRSPIGIHSHASDNRVVSVFRDDSDSYLARFEVWDVPAVTTNLTSENFIGFAPSAISDSASGTVNVTGNTSTQSGLTAGQKYHLQQNGTLSTTSVSTSVEAGIALSSTKLLIKG